MIYIIREVFLLYFINRQQLIVSKKSDFFVHPEYHPDLSQNVTTSSFGTYEPFGTTSHMKAFHENLLLNSLQTNKYKLENSEGSRVLCLLLYKILAKYITLSQTTNLLTGALNP